MNAFHTPRQSSPRHALRARLWLVVLTLCAVAPWSQPGVAFAAAPLLDQSHSAPVVSTASFSGPSRRGQIFTVGVAGTLARIEVAVGGSNATLAMDVLSVAGGLPTTVLDTATNPTDAAAGVKSFDFTGVFATPGQQLAFMLYDLSNSGGLANTGDSYAGGSRVSSNDGGASWILNPSDSNFSTWMRPVPVLIDAAIVVGAVPELANAGGTRRIVEPEIDAIGRILIVPEPGFGVQLAAELGLLAWLHRRRRYASAALRNPTRRCR